jgi:hypothetical protein
MKQFQGIRSFSSLAYSEQLKVVIQKNNLEHPTIIVKTNLLKKKMKQNKNATAHTGTNVRVRGFNAGLLARSQFASGKSCGRPTRSMFSVVFLGPRANAELVPKFHVALHASHAALPMVKLKISPCTNVTWTFDFDFGLDHPVHGRYG